MHRPDGEVEPISDLPFCEFRFLTEMELSALHTILEDLDLIQLETVSEQPSSHATSAIYGSKPLCRWQLNSN